MEHIAADQAFNLDGSGNMDPNDKCIPKFFYKAKHMEAKSKEAGRPIFEQDVMVEILIPGNMKPVTRKMIDADKSRWPMQWFKFEKMGEQAIVGTPIDQFPQLTVVQVEILKSLNVPSIEALANLGDEHVMKLGPDGRMLKERASRFLKASKDASFVENLQKQVDELRAQLAALADTPKTPKKRGRPPKVEA